MEVKAKKMKTLVSFISDEVFNRATAESNTSALVEALLAQHYGIDLPNDSIQAQMRHAAIGKAPEAKPVNLDGLIGGAPATEPTPAPAPVEVPAPTESPVAPAPAATTEAPAAPEPAPVEDELDDVDGNLDEPEIPAKPTPQSNDFADLGPKPTADTGVPVKVEEPAPAPAPEPASPAEPEVPFQPIIPESLAPKGEPATPVETTVDPASGIHPSSDALAAVEPVTEPAPQYNAGDKVCPVCGKSFNGLPYCLNCL